MRMIAAAILDNKQGKLQASSKHGVHGHDNRGLKKWHVESTKYVHGCAYCVLLMGKTSGVITSIGILALSYCLILGKPWVIVYCPYPSTLENS